MTLRYRVRPHSSRAIAITTLSAVATALILFPHLASADPSSTPGAEPSSTSTPAGPTSIGPTSAEPTGATPDPSASGSTASPAKPAPGSVEPSASAATASKSAIPNAVQKAGTLGVTTISGVLRDARNGAPIPSSCVGFRTAGSPQTNFTNVQQDGTWSFPSDEADGPVSLAFYVVDDYDCSGPVVTSGYLPSWYKSQPFTGLDPWTAVPPPAAAEVDPGTTDIVACLDPDGLPSECAVPNTTFSGRVVASGPLPISQACIFALGPSGPVGQTVSGEDGRWKITDLPIDVPFVVGVTPPFDVGLGPCQSDESPPVPAAGQLQPEFLTNTWLNLADEELLTDPYTWGTARGAESITNSRSDIDVCLTTDPGTVVPRSSCDAATSTPRPTDTAMPTSSASSQAAEPDSASGMGSSLADTGGPSGWMVVLAAGLLALGVTVVYRSRSRSR